MAAAGNELSMALDHAWDWFALHAVQRMQMLNYWLVAMAFLMAAYVGAMSDGSDALASAIAAVGAGASVAFHLLDRRTHQLIRIAEHALEELQAELATATGITALRMVEAAALKHGRFSRYGRIIMAMQKVAVLSFVIAAVAAVL